MRLRDLGIFTVIVAACGVVLAAAPGRSQSATQEPAIEIPVAPAAPGAPMAPAFPVVPRKLTKVGIPEPPSAPAVPEVPEFPMLNRAPSEPAAPAVPGTPAAPMALGPSTATAPVFWAGAMESNERGRNGSRHDGPATDCADLHIVFHDDPAMVESEERTFSKADSRALHINELENGGVQVQGWDKDTYSVTACKAANTSRVDAKELLSQIKLSVQAGRVSVSGPDRHNNEWTVYLLVRTPPAAEVDLKAHNGPASFYGVDGKITAHGTNGPITLADCSGEADIEAVNGPISFSGAGGKLRLHTQNGPISVNLHGANWDGSSLEAEAVNGPLSLNVSQGFRSSFLLESNGHSPISCHGTICEETRKTWDDEHRRIEYGSGTPLIHLSTQNGPISVNTL
jgi:DUF4097 and DUF4098 domain-containing protein YvlB